MKATQEKTDRNRKVFELLGRGKSMGDIARYLGISRQRVYQIWHNENCRSALKVAHKPPLQTDEKAL